MKRNTIRIINAVLFLTFSTIAWGINLSFAAESDGACDRYEDIKKYYQANPDKLDKKLVATAMNNCGIEYSDKKEWGMAERYLIKARKLDPENPVYERSLGVILANRAREAYEENRFRKARDDYQKALRHDPDNAQYKVALSEVLYRMEGKTRNARDLLSEGAEGIDTAALNARLEQYEQQAALEQKTKQSKRANWIVQMDPSIGEVSEDQVFDTIEEVSKAVGSDFRYWVKHRVIFVLVSQEDFQKIHGGPGWAGALNDGRIKIPVTGNYKNPVLFKAVMAHEFTHSVVNALAHSRPVPFLLHEGLAEYQEYKVSGMTPDFDAIRQAGKTGQLIPLQALASPHANQSLNSAQVQLAYQQAHSFVRYLEERRRFSSILSTLKYMGQGLSFDEAIVEGIGRNMDYLEEQWIRWLRQEKLL